MKKTLLILATVLCGCFALKAQQSTTTVEYRCPVYNTSGDPTSGIASWQTTSAEATEITNSTTTLTAGWYVVLDNDVQTGSLTCNGDVHLILADDAKLTATGITNAPGIRVSGDGNSLTIYGQTAQTGQLIATGGEVGGAGIGGKRLESGSNITINGGTITATTAGLAAGIGGGYQGRGFNITINGGTVTATGGTIYGQISDAIGNGKDATTASSNIFVDTKCIVKAGSAENPTTVIAPDHTATTDIAAELAGKRYATILQSYNIAVSANQTDAGTVTATCNGQPVESAPTGSEITVSATPADGYRFVNWTEDNIVVSTENPYTFTMTGDRNLVANFYDQHDFSTIRYTSANHEIVTPHASNVFGANIISNKYDTELDQGVIVFDRDVTSIGDNAFYECTNLVSINIPFSVTSIGELAFYYCTSLTSIEIPNSVTQIKQKAFYSCMGLTSITIPSSVTSIEAFTFSCSGLTSITIPSTVTRIGWAAFTYCTSLTSITIPENVTFIDGFAFDNCSSLTSINIPDNVTSIEKYTFNRCSRLTSIAIPSNVTSIGESAFSGCSGLTSISLPNGLLSLESFSFDNCTGLTSITIPSSVTSIGNGILSSCSSLQSVAVESGNAVYDSRENCNAIIETATNTMIAGFTFSDFPTSVTSIGNYAFYGCMGLTSMTIPSTVTKLGDNAFSGCSNLVSIIIPSTVTKLGDDTFSGCTSLVSITIPSSVESIGNDAFYHCSSLTSISLPNSLSSLGNFSFSNCTGLTSITIPNGSIGMYAFHECSKLESVILQEGVTSIGDFAFYECASLSSVDIPGSVASIGIYAFQDCRSLTSITIPNGSIGMWAFYGCSELESVILQNGVTSIADFAFYGRTKLPSITIPGSVESIGRAAFNGCSGLESVILQDGVKSIGEVAFYGCTNLTSITIPSSVEIIGGSAFDGCNFANIISKAETAPALASKIPNASNNVYIPTGALQSYQDRWGWYNYNFIEQDREACTFNGNSSNAWSDASNWDENAVPTKKCPSVFINADCQVDADAEVGAVTVATGMTLTVDTEKTLKPDGVTLENGAQLMNNGTVTCNDLTVKKDITGYGTGTGGWYLVSSPVGTIGIPSSMRTNPKENYDLYRFEQNGADGNEWINAKFVESQHIDFYLEDLSGYLYANKNNTTIVFHGNFAATETKTLAYDANADFPGFNLVGNPYPCNATISGTNLRSSNYYYMMNAGGTALEVVANPVLAPCTGVFAVAANSNATVTFAQTSDAANVTRGEKNALRDVHVELLANGKVIDRAILNTNGESLPKFRLNDNTSEICFYQNKEELAVASTDAAGGEMPLNFKAEKNGTYTITVNTENVEAEYLHLIDNLTGADVDLLAAASTSLASTTSSASYSFEAKTDDYASRFKLVFGVKDAASTDSAGDFAFISNGEIIISNEGRATLQIIDVLGRIVSSEEINGECRISTNGLTAGLYILNLDGKTQKIVVK